MLPITMVTIGLSAPACAAPRTVRFPRGSESAHRNAGGQSAPVQCMAGLVPGPTACYAAGSSSPRALAVARREWPQHMCTRAAQRRPPRGGLCSARGDRVQQRRARSETERWAARLRRRNTGGRLTRAKRAHDGQRQQRVVAPVAQLPKQLRKFNLLVRRRRRRLHSSRRHVVPKSQRRRLTHARCGDAGGTCCYAAYEQTRRARGADTIGSEERMT